EELRVGFWGLIMHDHPDSLLLRFLRARKWVVVKALEGAVLTLQWRVRENLAEIVREGEAKLNLRTLQIGQAYMHGVDKQQRPVCYIAARHHNKDLQPFEDIRRFTLWTMETVRLMIHPPVETVDILFDLGDFTMANMDYNFVKFIVQCFQAYYPESLGVYVVANAPWVFWGIWKIITPLLDPVVASKFQCARKVNDLQEYIDPSWLLPSLGGTDERGFTYLPYRKEDDYRLNDEAGRAEHQAALDALNTRFVAQTRDWIAAGENAAALETASKERDGTADEMRTAFFKLDPYVRSRTFYHRLGVLGEDGSCDW
ncbi:CRAL-TRIO domain-containing protein, partial [Thamnocephalis sphaerospora]